MKLPVLLALLISAVCAAAAPKNPATTSTVPPPESVVREFFTYLLAGKRDIAADARAQERWLTKALRQTLATSSAAAKKAAKAHPDKKIDPPGNETFLAAWDAPTTFQVTDTKVTKAGAHVDLRYTWGPKTQYPGETRNLTVRLVLEGEAWRVDDIESHKSKFSEAGTLRGDLRQLAAQK